MRQKCSKRQVRRTSIASSLEAAGVVERVRSIRSCVGVQVWHSVSVAGRASSAIEAAGSSSAEPLGSICASLLEAMMVSDVSKERAWNSEEQGKVSRRSEIS